MRLKLPSQPTSENLVETFGFRLPDSFVEILQALYKETNHNLKQCASLFYDTFGWQLSDNYDNYESSPVELHRFADFGVDGLHLGYVIHAPELQLPDYPIGSYCPMDSDGVYLVGNNTLEAFTALAAQYANSEDVQVQKFLAELNISFNSGIENEPFATEGQARTVVPSIPTNWKFLPTEDGIGVLAPEIAFEPKSLQAIGASDTFWKSVELAERAFAHNFPATALAYLRIGYWHHWTDELGFVELSIRMIKAYEILNRKGFAEAAQKRMNEVVRKRIKAKYPTNFSHK